MTQRSTDIRERSRYVLSEPDLADLESRNEEGDISGTDVVRLLDAVRYLQQIHRSK